MFLLLLVLIKGQVILNAMTYLNEKFYYKIDTNIFYRSYILDQTPGLCNSNLPQCQMINKKKLDDMVDHSLDHLKTGIVEKLMHHYNLVNENQVYYYIEQYRSQLDEKIDKRVYV